LHIKKNKQTQEEKHGQREHQNGQQLVKKAQTFQIHSLGCTCFPLGRVKQEQKKQETQNGDVDGLNPDVSVEHLIIAASHAVVDPGTVVVKHVDALIALVAVSASWVSEKLALKTESACLVFYHKIKKFLLFQNYFFF
jgi:hypothetical protein